jgi:membrane protein YqaA with SNARE-associated domain
MNTNIKTEVQEVIHEVGEREAEAAPPGIALPPLAIPEIRVGRIFAMLGVYYAALIVTRVFLLPGPSLLTLFKHFADHTSVTASPSILFDYFAYMSLACQFFPLPTLPPVAFTAKAFSPIVVSLIGAIGTCIANLNDYAILGWLFRHHRVKKVRDISTYRRLLYWFDRYAFLTLTAATFLPIPIDVIRMLAISRAYSYWKYIAATFTGRFPRYLLIATLGKELPVKYILIIFVVSVLPALAKLISDIIRKKRTTAA